MQLSKAHLIRKLVILSMSAGISVSATAMTYDQLEALSS